MTLKTTRRRGRVDLTIISGCRVFRMIVDRETAADWLAQMEGRE